MLRGSKYEKPPAQLSTGAKPRDGARPRRRRLPRGVRQVSVWLSMTLMSFATFAPKLDQRSVCRAEAGAEHGDQGAAGDGAAVGLHAPDARAARRR